MWLSAHLVCTLLMVGIIWFVQIVHYPLLAEVGRDDFLRYERKNTSRTTWVVTGPMVLEVLTAVAIFLWHPAIARTPLFLAATILLGVVWISTVVWQVPAHRVLAKGYDAEQIRRLVRTNWVRTLAWTARAVLLGMLWLLLG